MTGGIVLWMKINAHYYQQFDADLGRAVPAEGYGGWKQGQIELNRGRTALVVMHAWDAGTAEAYPGWYRAVEYLPRAAKVTCEVFPAVLGAARASGFAVLHVVGGGDYYKNLPGYQRAVRLAGPSVACPKISKPDPVMDALHQFRSESVFVGAHNRGDCGKGFEKLDFPAEAKPVGDEGVAENAQQLFALCEAQGINHLIYMGFALNWCLLMSPGSMLEMSRHGVMCSAIRQGVTAVENKESARGELHKEEALWRTSLAFGFVFDDFEFVRAVRDGEGSGVGV